MRAHRRQQILLVLVGLALELDLPTARRARARQRHPDLLIDMLRDRPVPVPAAVGAAATTRPPRVGLRLGAVVGATPTFSGAGTKTLSVNLKPGTYAFYCSVDGHRAAGMQGTLTVK